MANQVAGFLGAILAAFLWGSFAVPVKMVNTGDGFVFQWVRPHACISPFELTTHHLRTERVRASVVVVREWTIFTDRLFCVPFLQVECSAILVVGIICEFIVGTFRIYPLGTARRAWKACSDDVSFQGPLSLSSPILTLHCNSYARWTPLVPR